MGSYAVISDIHGNIAEMERVWLKLESLGLTGQTVFNAGDTVAYGDDSAGCIDFIRSHRQIVSVGGNYDCNVTEFPQNESKFERKWKVLRPEKFDALKQASDQISSEQREWLRDLPRLLEFSVEEKTFGLCHYSPIGKKVGLGVWTSDEDLLSIAAACSYDVIITGHTHSAFVRKAGRTLFINPGSVGRSWGSPTFAVITVNNGEVYCEVMT